MRHCWWFFAVALAISTPATADITATYGVSGGRLPNMVIRVNDRGDSRTTTGNQMAVLTVGGETYIVMADLNGLFAVRQGDVMTAFSDLVAGQSPELASSDETSGAHSPSYEIVEAGTETVGGREGTVLSVRREGQDPDIADRYVVSRDPRLAPIGAVLARQFSASTNAMRGVADVTGFWAYIADIFARGTVIRFGNLFRLESVDEGEIPSSEFALPETILTRDEFAARMGWPGSR